MNLDDEEFKDATQELEEITIDFCENYKLDVDEFNGMMLAQIVRYYIDNEEHADIRRILTDVIKSIDDIEAGNRVTLLDQFIEDQENEHYIDNDEDIQ